MFFGLLDSVEDGDKVVQTALDNYGHVGMYGSIIFFLIEIYIWKRYKGMLAVFPQKLLFMCQVKVPHWCLKLQ